MSEWWDQDTSVWPGPDERDPREIWDTFVQFGRMYGRAASVVVHGTIELTKGLEEQIRTLYGVGPTPIEKIWRLDPKPNLNKNGPRRGSTFDHRGRRRW